MPWLQLKNTNHRKGPESISSLKASGLTEMLLNKNYLNEPKNREFKKAAINLIKKFKEFKEYSKENNTSMNLNSVIRNALVMSKQA